MEKNNKSHKLLDIVSNTTQEGISATGLAGMLIIIVGLLTFVACVLFYFFNIAEANNVFTLVNSSVTVLGIGSGILVGRRISSDFGPNNRLVIGEQIDGDGSKYQTVRRNRIYSSSENNEEQETPEVQEETQN